VGFGVLCGVGLAAGGFTVTAGVYLFNLKRFHSIVRPSLLTAFLGYLLVIVALFYDLGRSPMIWHPLIMWNPHSVMFEVGWCVMCYTTVMSLEFAPIVCERFGWTRLEKILKKAVIPLVMLGVMFSTLHQSSLGSLYLIVPERLYPLWYSPLLPVLFYISAIAVGLAMVIFESFLSRRAFGKEIEIDLLQDLARVLVVVLGFYLVLRFEDLATQGTLGYAFRNTPETAFFWLEVLGGGIFPAILLSQRRIRESGGGLFLSSVLVVLGFVMNRLNVSLTGMHADAIGYFPRWTEISVTLMIVALGFAGFRLAVKYLPIFEEHKPGPGEPPDIQLRARMKAARDAGEVVPSTT
jgi:Ni/Fe-hydrogenase subunit HybB-like protein